MIIAIDGPAGAGKSSTAKAIARKIGIDYIDSGAMYRGFTAIYLKNDKDERKFFENIDKNKLSFTFTEDKATVYLDGDDISDYIRSEEINDHVSTVAAMGQIRKRVFNLLREIVAKGESDYIAEGRDLGTVVFPEAELKIFLTANLEVRANRRLQETNDHSNTEKLKAIKSNLQNRDEKDSSRKEAPLKKAEDAIEIDTTELNFDQQVDVIIELIQKIKSGKIPNQ